MVETVANERALVAESVIRKYVAFAVGGAAIPVPLADLAVITGVQLRMIQQLSKVYGKTFSEGPVRASILSLTGGTLSLVLGGVASSLIKVVPFVGTALGELGLPILAGSSTYAVGQVYLHHFERGGEAGDLKAADFAGAYKEHFSKGKAVAEETTPAEEAEAPVAEPA